MRPCPRNRGGECWNVLSSEDASSQNMLVIYFWYWPEQTSSACSTCPSVHIHLECVECGLSVVYWKMMGLKAHYDWEFRAPSHWFWDLSYQLTATVGWEKNQQVLSFPLEEIPCMDGPKEMRWPRCNAGGVKYTHVTQCWLTRRTFLHLGFLMPHPISLHPHWQTLSDLYHCFFLFLNFI